MMQGLLMGGCYGKDFRLEIQEARAVLEKRVFYMEISSNGSKSLGAFV